MGNGWNPITGVDPDGNNPSPHVAVLVINTPVAVYNFYKVRDAAIKQGDNNSLATVKGGFAAFASYVSAILIKNPMLNGVITGAGLEVINQELDGKEKINWMNVSSEASKGGMVGAAAGLGQSLFSKYLFVEGATLIGATTGTIAGTEMLEKATPDHKIDATKEDK